MHNSPRIILASTSPFRQALLKKLRIAFETVSPCCDENALKNEQAIDLVQRLAKEKARSCQLSSNQLLSNQLAANQLAPKPALIIGSDQVCVINGEILGKPHNRENAIKQLTQASGQSITFYTGLAVHNTATQQTDVCLDTFTVHFRTLTQAQIEFYVDTEQPFECAGSFKSEGLGIALFKKMEGDDPNSLIGLPLIKLTDMLAKHGVEILMPL